MPVIAEYTIDQDIPAGSVLQFVSADPAPSESFVNVRDVGAVGDGAHDDTNAIRAALTLARVTGKDIYIPTGTYAVCPQPGDAIGPGFSRPILNCDGTHDITIYGDSSGSLIRCFYDGLTDPRTHWMNTGDSYIKIARFVFFLGMGASNVTFRHLAIDGGAGWTGDYTVGGNTQTGDGWDMGHKAFMFGNSDGITFEDVTAHNWRGEIIYAGGTNGKISMSQCDVDGSNASAISCSADMLIENCFIGGQVYNAVENQCIDGTQRLIARRSSFAGKVNGVVYIGVPDASLTLDSCDIHNCRHGLLLSNLGSNITIYDTHFDDNSNAVITSIMAPPPHGFRNAAFLNNQFNNCASVIVLQDPIDGLTVAGNTRDGQPWELN